MLYIKYGELMLKGKNKKIFTNKMNNNIRCALVDFQNIKVNRFYDCTTIDNIDENDLESIINILKIVPGISNIIRAYESSLDLDILANDIVKYLPKTPKTFKVETRRKNKNYSLNSLEISCFMGEKIIDLMPEYSAKMHNPELNIHVEIQDKKSLFFFDKIKGCGGFPVGTGGKVLVLLSGGIDSPVAAIQFLKKGYSVDFLTFVTPPHTPRICVG